MEAVVADNALELAIIGGLMAIIVAFITIGSIAIFRQGSKIDRLGEELAKTNRELSEKIAQSHQELSDKIDAKVEQLRADMTRQMEQLRNDMTRQMERTKAEIIAALVNHSHPDPGGPPVFTAPPPARPEPPAQNGTPDQPTAEPQAAPADD